jgi:general secretion pathway protein A
MYKSFFGLNANPFNVNPDPRFLYMTRHMEEALACLAYGIQTRKGFMLLTGEVGTGKTTILNKILDWLRTQRVQSAFVFNPRLEVTQFLAYMCNDMGIPCESRDKGQILQKLNRWLLERYRESQTAVLIVDEAQNLSMEMLEEIRLLTNLETSTEKLLQIVLCGQPELELKLRAAELRQLRQRITLSCRTYPLTADQTRGYIEQRLRIAGACGAPIFSSSAIDAISKYSKGIPRIINLLCEHSLINAFVEQQHEVSQVMVDEVARDFELDNVPAFASVREPLRSHNLAVIDESRLGGTVWEGRAERAGAVREEKKQ